MLYMCAASQQTICLYKTSPEFQCVYTVYSLYCTMYPNSPQLWVCDPLLKAPPWLPPSSSVLDGAVPRTWAPGIGANIGGLEVVVENRWSRLFSSQTVSLSCDCSDTSAGCGLPIYYYNKDCYIWLYEFMFAGNLSFPVFTDCIQSIRSHYRCIYPNISGYNHNLVWTAFSSTCSVWRHTVDCFISWDTLCLSMHQYFGQKLVKWAIIDGF